MASHDLIWHQMISVQFSQWLIQSKCKTLQTWMAKNINQCSLLYLITNLTRGLYSIWFQMTAHQSEPGQKHILTIKSNASQVNTACKYIFTALEFICLGNDPKIEQAVSLPSWQRLLSGSRVGCYQESRRWGLVCVAFRTLPPSQTVRHLHHVRERRR